MRYSLRFWLWAMAALALASPVQATTILSRTTNQLFHDADLVATVQVGDVHAEQAGGHITTHATLTVTESFKGAAKGTTIQVLIPGGVAGKWGQRIEGTPVLSTGETCIVFLRKTRSTVQFLGMEQGKLAIEGTVVRRTATAQFVEKGSDGQLHDAVLPPETEPLQPLLQHLRNLGGAR